MRIIDERLSKILIVIEKIHFWNKVGGDMIAMELTLFINPFA